MRINPHSQFSQHAIHQIHNPHRPRRSRTFGIISHLKLQQTLHRNQLQTIFRQRQRNRLCRRQIPDRPNTNVSPLLNGKRRRSYVMWKESVVPLIAIEFTSGNGSEERDRTSPFSVGNPKAGKFWVYEQAVRIPFYAIYEVEKASVDVYELVNSDYQKCIPNQRGHYPIPALGVELGIWQGEFMHQDLPWLRWWDSYGNLLMSGDERAERADRKAEEADRRAEQLAAKLRELGINPDEL